MTFVAGTQLGPYDIIALIGAGGMGEVYRARDTRLLREVALKVLPAAFTTDPDRLGRFEQEARAVAALNHPNIVFVHDVGTAHGVHYIVSELLDGETLRQQISPSGMPPRKVIELGVQLAHGLAAAHDKGIVHRDLKPENIVITRGGQLKILDFGVAKLQRPATGADTMGGGVTTADTGAGQILGTVGYMSPEQVRGETADHRSDIFSLGSMLYEMVSGERAFTRKTSAETMTAILNEDPPEFSGNTRAIPPALERMVLHCLEKQPGRRFQSTHDLAFALESLSFATGAIATAPPAARTRWLAPAAAAAVLLAVAFAVVAGLRPPTPQVHPTFHRLTFRRGTVWNARFAPEENIIYGAAWEGRPVELFAAETGSGPESRPLNLPTAALLAISGAGELAVSSDPHVATTFRLTGMLARAPRGGGAPRDIADDVEYADWSPDSATLAVVRRVGGRVTLEYPLRKVLYETAGWISHPRISPDGKSVAFVDHLSTDDGGAIALVDQAGNKRTLSRAFVSAQGLAWTQDGSEVWFTATPSGSNRELRAVTLSGKERLIYAGTGTLTLLDVSKGGRALLSRDDLRSGIIGLPPGQSTERDLSWHDWTLPRDLSEDGKLIAFDETGEAGGETGGVYIRRTDGSPAVHLGDGQNPSLSPDGKWVLASPPAGGVIMLPTGPGESRTIATGDVQVQRAFFFPDGRRILEVGSTRDRHAVRLWVQDVERGAPRPISPEGVSVGRRTWITPDGTRVAAQDPERTITVYPVEGGTPVRIPSTEPGDVPIRWADGTSLLIGRPDVRAPVFLINTTSGQRKPFKVFSPPDPSGLVSSSPPQFSRDLKAYVYGYSRITSDLYVVDGLK